MRDYVNQLLQNLLSRYKTSLKFSASAFDFKDAKPERNFLGKRGNVSKISDVYVVILYPKNSIDRFRLQSISNFT